jgi:hypothetical protein
MPVSEDASVMNIQERAWSEKRKCQKPVILTSTKLGEVSDKPSDRKEYVGIVLSDKQETCLKEIYRRMPDAAEQLIAQGFHKAAFDVVVQEMRFKHSVDFWTITVMDAYRMVLFNMYWLHGNVDGRAVDLLKEIELAGDLKLFASFWEMTDDNKIVRKNGKIIIEGEASPTLMRLLGNQLDRTILLLLQHFSNRNYDDANRRICQLVRTKINEDRPYFESRCAWKIPFQSRCPWDKDMGDFDYDGSHKLVNLSLMWEKMVGYRRGMILECNGRCPREMVKSVVTYVKAKPVKNRPMETKKRKMCCIESVHTICK